MKISPWNSPYSGLLYFLTHPSLWGWTFLGTIVSGAITVFLFIKVVQWSYPTVHPGWGTYFWHLFQSLGWGFLTLVLMIAIAFPLIFNACFARGFCNLLKREGVHHLEESMMAAVISSFWVFFRTLKWRILWPLLLVVTIFIVPLLIYPVSLLAANHLTVIESSDLVLTLFGKTADERVHWIRSHGADCFAFAVSGSIFSFFLSLTAIGWIFWIPAIYCGAFLWIRSLIKEVNS